MAIHIRNNSRQKMLIVEELNSYRRLLDELNSMNRSLGAAAPDLVNEINYQKIKARLRIFKLQNQLEILDW